MSNNPETWQTDEFRQMMIEKLLNGLNSNGIITANDQLKAKTLESKIFRKCHTGKEYCFQVARLIATIKKNQLNVIESNNVNNTIQTSSTNNDYRSEMNVARNINISRGNSQPNQGILIDIVRSSEITDAEKVLIHKRAIAVVVNSLQIDDEIIDKDVDKFSKFIAVKLNRITNDEDRLQLQQKILAIIN